MKENEKGFLLLESSLCIAVESVLVFGLLHIALVSLERTCLRHNLWTLARNSLVQVNKESEYHRSQHGVKLIASPQGMWATATQNRQNIFLQK